MNTLPSYVGIPHPGGWSEKFPPLERTEMERGPAKQRRPNSRLLKTVTALFMFESAEDAIAFEDWYVDELNAGVEWFTMRHPLYKTTITARFVEGDIGELVALSKRFGMSQRTVRLEYFR